MILNYKHINISYLAWDNNNNNNNETLFPPEKKTILLCHDLQDFPPIF